MTTTPAGRVSRESVLAEIDREQRLSLSDESGIFNALRARIRTLPSAELPAIGVSDAWQPIETIPFTLDESGGKWIEWHVLGRFDEYGFVSWIGGMDSDMWLERHADRSCDDDPPKATHWHPLEAALRPTGEDRG
jgi:isopentenyl diphosphate isomerase/L-lactate dehydrogenase-like FMN-dependent dehydrogenase